MSAELLREAARRAHAAHSPVTMEDVQTGALLRIADACEAMVGDYTRVRAEADRYRQYWEESRERAAGYWATIEGMTRARSYYRNRIARMKAQIELLEDQRARLLVAALDTWTHWSGKKGDLLGAVTALRDLAHRINNEIAEAGGESV